MMSEAGRLRVSEADRARLRARASRELCWAMLAQVGMMLAACVLAAFWAGRLAGLSALAGGASYLLTNGWLALRLFVSVRKSVAISPAAFMGLGLLKLLMTALLLWGLAYVAGEWLVWPAVLLGLVFTLKGYVLLLLFRKLS